MLILLYSIVPMLKNFGEIEGLYFVRLQAGGTKVYTVCTKSQMHDFCTNSETRLYPQDHVCEHVIDRFNFPAICIIFPYQE